MIIKNSDITIKKVNWIDKASNIGAIAKELNIGLDSSYFVVAIDATNIETPEALVIYRNGHQVVAHELVELPDEKLLVYWKIE